MADETIAFAGYESVEAASTARNGGLGDDDTIDPAVVEDVADHLVLGEDGRFRFRYHRPAVVTGWGEVCHPLPTALERRPRCSSWPNGPSWSRRHGRRSGGRLGDDLRVERIDCRPHALLGAVRRHGGAGGRLPGNGVTRARDGARAVIG